MKTTHRLLSQALVACIASVALGVVHAQDNWPTAPVKIIVPFPPGGTADLLTRVMAERLAAKLGQTWIVDNKSGAGGNIGMEAGKNATDGHTIISATIGTLSINQFLVPKMPYDSVADYVYVSKFWENCNALVVPGTHPAKTVKEFLDWAKAKPQGVTYGTSGVGTTPHLSAELFRTRTGISTVHVPFRGGPQSVQALLAGDTDFAIDNLGNYSVMIKAGKAKALAVTCPQRWPAFPEIPTMSEAGIKDFVITSWGAFVMPKGTPAAVANKVSAAILEIAKDPAVKERFIQIGAMTVGSTPRELEIFAESERVKWKDVVRLSGATKD